MKRRVFLRGAIASFALPVFPWAIASATAAVSESASVSGLALTPAQSRAFRAWMVRIVSTQLSAGPTPRWTQRDCAGLVRFAVAEALREHDEKWKRANGLAGQPVPPEVQLAGAQQSLRHAWHLADGSVSVFADALELVQENCGFRGKDCNQAQAGDLLFFDQGDAQHLMIWMGSFIAYHTGTVTDGDNGLRAVSLGNLMHWNDTRWHPSQDNPNFAGVYRLNFLSA